MKNPLGTDRHHRQRSLFGEIVDWMLVPFLILWPISMAIEYAIAYSVASTTYDRDLAGSAGAIARQVGSDRGRVVVNLPRAAQAMLLARGTEDSRYQVRGLKGEVLEGDRGLPNVDFTPDLEPGRVYFRDEFLDGRELRVAYLFAQPVGITGAVLVQVAEAEDKRIALASDISSAVLMSQFLILPLALLLVSFGLSKGIEPLDDLRRRIRSRPPQDLSPVDPTHAPEEVRPFIDSINDLMARLDASLRARQRFVADAAHQMRTPLAGLKTQAELALRQKDGASVEHAMRQIATGADRASRLVSQLLALARAERDAPVPMVPEDLVGLARELVRDWYTRAVERGIALGFEAPATPCRVRGNAALLRELLANLLDNAIRYTEPGGEVLVRVVAGDAVTLEVVDTGTGISPDERELVFERFYRVLGTGADGSGLGLAIVREIATLHQGSVRLDENPRGKGSLFRVVLPTFDSVRSRLRSVA